MSYLIRQSFQRYRCESGNSIFARGQLEITLTVPLSIIYPRLLDGNLDPTKLYSVRIEQNGPGANLMVKVSTDEDKGLK